MDEEKIKGSLEDVTPVVPSSQKTASAKSKILWTVLFVIIAALTIVAIMSQGEFSFTEFMKFLSNLDPFWVAMAFLSMLGIIFFEGFAIITIVKSLGYRKSIGHGYIYASGDIYFSAITPSATGGQPASAFFMMKDGIPGPTVTVALVVNLIMYTFAILLLGIISFILKPSIFLGFSTLSQILIVIGAITLCLVAVSFIFILVKSSVLYKMCSWVLGVLAKLRLIRNLEAKREKLRLSIDLYAGHVSSLGGKRGMLVKALIFNFLQRACLIAVTLFVFLAQGGAVENGVDVWVSQCMVVLGSNTVPIPGAMGVSDLMLIDAFGALGFADGAAMNLNLLTRAISFYTCVILCGASMVVRLISYKIISENQKKRFAVRERIDETDENNND